MESFQKRERNRRSIQRRQDKEFRRKQRADDKKHGRSPEIPDPTLDPMTGEVTSAIPSTMQPVAPTSHVTSPRAVTSPHAASSLPAVPNATAPAAPPKEQSQ
ncbi:MAG: hypothetical protein ACKVWV_05325 [Planctomycetota bacterium]